MHNIIKSFRFGRVSKITSSVTSQMLTCKLNHYNGQNLVREILMEPDKIRIRDLTEDSSQCGKTKYIFEKYIKIRLANNICSLLDIDATPICTMHFRNINEETTPIELNLCEVENSITIEHYSMETWVTNDACKT